MRQRLSTCSVHVRIKVYLKVKQLSFIVNFVSCRSFIQINCVINTHITDNPSIDKAKGINYN